MKMKMKKKNNIFEVFVNVRKFGQKNQKISIAQKGRIQDLRNVTRVISGNTPSRVGKPAHWPVPALT